MSVNSKAVSVPRIRRLAEDKQVSEATRFARYSLLDESPGLIFGLMTVVCIVGSLARSCNPQPAGRIYENPREHEIYRYSSDSLYFDRVATLKHWVAKLLTSRRSELRSDSRRQ
jgi:hypothetical protein